jgi:hypothetical protein
MHHVLTELVRNDAAEQHEGESDQRIHDVLTREVFEEFHFDLLLFMSNETLKKRVK